MRKIRYLSYILTPIFMVCHGFSATPVPAPAPFSSTSTPNPNPAPAIPGAYPAPSPSAVPIAPAMSVPPSAANGVISYPVGPQFGNPAPAGANNLGGQPPKKPDPVKEPLVSQALEQELASKGLEAKKLFAVIENNKIYLVGPKPKAKVVKKKK